MSRKGKFRRPQFFGRGAPAPKRRTNRAKSFPRENDFQKKISLVCWDKVLGGRNPRVTNEKKRKKKKEEILIFSRNRKKPGHAIKKKKGMGRFACIPAPGGAGFYGLRGADIFRTSGRFGIEGNRRWKKKRCAVTGGSSKPKIRSGADKPTVICKNRLPRKLGHFLTKMWKGIGAARGPDPTTIVPKIGGPFNVGLSRTAMDP